MKIDVKELEKIFDDIKQNKKQGIEELYNKYKGIVYGIAFTISKNKEDSEDIMQIIFAKIYEMEDFKLPTNNCASWLYSITKNETINFEIISLVDETGNVNVRYPGLLNID